MSNNFISFAVNDTANYKQKMLNWANRFNIFCLLDNHQYASPYNSYECVLAAGAEKYVSAGAGRAFDLLKAFQHANRQEWLFGHFGYDLKNETEQLTSSLPNYVSFPDLFFFVPSVIILIKNNEIAISSKTLSAEKIFREIEAEAITVAKPASIHFKARFSKEDYLATVEQLKQHILRGDCYEINLCQEFFANTAIDPVQVFDSLGSVSPNPFAAMYKVNDQYLLCASPERYLKKEGSRVLSQPIKGTIPRDVIDEVHDEFNKQQLLASAKDRAENVMVVDLVRNDLSKVCTEGSVVVDELYGIYAFPQVYQMISTVSGTIRPELDITDVVRATFPMGSMTGAPKKRVMELIEQYERTKRGIYSGAVGYIHPNGDADFNVVIRSLLYNSKDHYLSYLVGSAITWYCDAEQEYEECLVKAAAIKTVLE